MDRQTDGNASKAVYLPVLLCSLGGCNEDVYRGCTNPVTATGHTSVDIGVNTHLELVDKFCYLADMSSVDGDADAAMDTRIRIGWNKFRYHCLPIRIYH